MAVQMRRPGDQSHEQRGHAEDQQRSSHRGRSVVRMMTGLFGEAFLAPERHEIRTERVERRHQRCEQRDAKDHLVEVAMLRVLTRREQDRQNLILRPEAGQQRKARQRERSRQERDVRDRQRLPQAAEPPHVDHVAHRVHHRTGGQEQHGLEEGVREHVEHCERHRVCRETHIRSGCSQRHEHVPKLTDRRIRQHALEVVLRERRDRRNQRSRGPDPRHEHLRRRSQHKKRSATCHEVHASRDHRRRVNQCRDRCWASHRVRQPRRERQLRTLARRTKNQESRNHLEHRNAVGQFLARLGNFMDVQRAELTEHQKHRQHEKRITDSIDHERLASRIGIRKVRVPKSDQQVRGDTHALPTDEQHRVRIAKHQNQHHPDEEIQVREEPREALVAVHVPGGKDVNQKSNTRDDQRH